jgi:exopolysaccharide production protein ExoQ
MRFANRRSIREGAFGPLVSAFADRKDVAECNSTAQDESIADRLGIVAAVFVFIANSQPFLLQLSVIDPGPPVRVSSPLYLYVKVLLLCILLVLAWRAYPKMIQIIIEIPFPLLTGVLAMCSALWSYDPYVTFRSALQLSPSILVCYVFSIRYDTKTLTTIALHALGVALTLSLIWVVIFPDAAMHTGADIVQEGHENQWRGIYPHKNTLGLIAGLGVALFLMTGRVLIAHRGLSLLYLTAAFSCLIGAGSAGGVVACVSGVSVGLILSIRSRTLRIGMISAFIPMAFIVFLFSEPIVGFLLELVGRDPTLTGRTLLWQAALELFSRHPIFGYGYPSVSDPEVQYAFYAANNAANAHSAFLQILVETGIVGFAIWIMALAYGLRGLAGMLTLNSKMPPEFEVLGIVMIATFITGVGEIELMLTAQSMLGQFWMLSVIALTHYSRQYRARLKLRDQERANKLATARV